VSVGKFPDMYNGVYDKLADAGIAEVLNDEVWLDRHGNIVLTEAEAYGRKTKFLLKHPEKLIFVDEVDDNMAILVAKSSWWQDIRAPVWHSFKDNHFTVLGFTAADGRTIVCAIIIAVSKLRVTDMIGSDPLSKDAEDIRDDDIQGLETYIEEMKYEHSNGIDRLITFGTTCTFNGIKVPIFVTCSKNGSITSQLLTNMLQRMDRLDVV
jgi:hypothetical protein